MKLKEEPEERSWLQPNGAGTPQVPREPSCHEAAGNRARGASPVCLLLKSSVSLGRRKFPLCAGGAGKRWLHRAVLGESLCNLTT